MRHLGPRMPCPSPCMARLQGNVPLGPACSTLITSDRDWVSTVQGRLCTPERTESGVREDEMASHLGASSTDATCQVHRLEKNNIAGHGPQRKGGGGGEKPTTAPGAQGVGLARPVATDASGKLNVSVGL